MAENRPFTNSVNVTGNKTLTAADSGIVQNVVADATITLPSTALGLQFVIRNGGDNPANTPAGAVSDGTVNIAVSPAAADGITGNGFTATVNKDAINTKATSKVGDMIALLGTGTAGVTGWNIAELRGVWNREI